VDGHHYSPRLARDIAGRVLTLQPIAPVPDDFADSSCSVAPGLSSPRRKPCPLGYRDCGRFRCLCHIFQRCSSGGRGAACCGALSTHPLPCVVHGRSTCCNILGQDDPGLRFPAPLGTSWSEPSYPGGDRRAPTSRNGAELTSAPANPPAPHTACASTAQDCTQLYTECMQSALGFLNNCNLAVELYCSFYSDPFERAQCMVDGHANCATIYLYMMRSCLQDLRDCLLDTNNQNAGPSSPSNDIPR
jgi:hypothetical protein